MFDSSVRNSSQRLIAESGDNRFTMAHFKLPYEQILRSAGHRLTNQRQLILDSVCEGGDHTTLGEIYVRVHERDKSVDRSTLYRTLKLFVDLGIIVSADIGNGELYYEIAKTHHHHHLVCRQCGRTQEIDDSVMQVMFDQVVKRYGFRTDSDHLVLFGICADCRQPQ